jgi:hypothetical protein
VTVAVTSGGVARTEFSDIVPALRSHKLASFKILRTLALNLHSPTSYVKACHRLTPRPLSPTNVRPHLNFPTIRIHNWKTMATLSAQRKHKVTVVGSGNWYV